MERVNQFEGTGAARRAAQRTQILEGHLAPEAHHLRRNEAGLVSAAHCSGAAKKKTEPEVEGLDTLYPSLLLVCFHSISFLI